MNAGAALRADTARALARIVFDGVSLRPAFADAAARIADPRDRALLAASLFAATRWWLRLDGALGQLLAKPLPTKAREIRALLVVGLAQLSVLGLPDYAVAAACVDAARQLGHPRHAGLVNAVLRRWLREHAAIEAALDRAPVTRWAHPPWLIAAIRHDWPDQADAILAANNREAMLTLRVNRRRSDTDALIERLRGAGIECDCHPALADAIVVAQSTDVTRLPGYAEGLFSVQDGAAQAVADLLDLHDGQRVLDACAAPGGKSAHMLERADLHLLALDRDADRLARVAANLERLGLGAELRAADATAPADWWDGRAFDRILLDVPCSALGVLRRQPDIRLHRRAADLPALAEQQAALIAAMWPMLAPGGKLVYATCSVLRVENEQVVSGFLASHADARALPLDAGFGVSAGAGRQRLPGTDGMDGFFYALLEKIA